MPKAIPATFCVIPWLHRHTDEQGDHKLCCIADGPTNHLVDKSGQRLHVSQKLTDAEVLNSPLARAARVAMMHGKWPAACRRCEQVEKATGESARKHLNERFDVSRHEQLVEDTSPDGTIGHPVVRYADIRLGNVCNLTCRMCGPIASRLWVPHFNQVQPQSYRMPAEELTILGQNNWVKHESVGWLLDQNIEHIETLHFAGGEPLILPEMVEALEICVASGRSHEIELSYNTNLTVLPEKVTSLWHKFRSVTVLCSVDGFGKTTEYIRRPSKWKDIDRNLRALDDNFEEWKIKWATVSCTTQILNILDLDKLFSYLRESDFKHVTPVPQLIPLYYPNYLSIQALPSAAKDIARAQLQRQLERTEALNSDSLVGMIGSIRATMSFMDAADTTADLPDFLSFSEASDKAFGDSWREAAPELAEQVDSFMQPPPKPTGFAGLLQRFIHTSH